MASPASQEHSGCLLASVQPGSLPAMVLVRRIRLLLAFFLPGPHSSPSFPQGALSSSPMWGLTGVGQDALCQAAISVNHHAASRLTERIRSHRLSQHCMEAAILSVHLGVVVAMTVAPCPGVRHQACCHSQVSASSAHVTTSVPVEPVSCTDWSHVSIIHKRHTQRARSA